MPSEYTHSHSTKQRLTFFWAFLFGVAMCLLYLKTKILLIHMAAHALNNFIAAAWSAWSFTGETQSSLSRA